MGSAERVHRDVERHWLESLRAAQVGITETHERRAARARARALERAAWDRYGPSDRYLDEVAPYASDLMAPTNPNLT